MTIKIYTSDARDQEVLNFLPWNIVKDILKFRHLVISMVILEFRSVYKASYLGLSWQVILPLIMLSIYYFVFGQILGGRFLNNSIERPIDYALALYVGMGLFNVFVQNMGAATTLLISNSVYLKILSFPLEILPVINVLVSLIGLIIALTLALLAFIFFNGLPHLSVFAVPIYILFLFQLSLGISYLISSLSVFIRDITAIILPVSQVLMFMCPIFYPMSMVPQKLKWLIEINPLAMIIEGVRGALLYGYWPSFLGLIALFLVSTFIFVIGYFVFMRLKPDFADVI